LNSETSFYELLVLWKAQQLPLDTVVGGLSLLWWGRIGKIALFVGSLTVVAELIGPKRLREFGAKLHDAIGDKYIKNTFSSYKKWLLATSIFWTSLDDEKVDKAMKESGNYKVDYIFTAWMLIAMIVSIVIALKVTTNWFMITILFLIGSIAGVLSGLVIVTLFSIITLLFIVVMEYLIIEPVAWLLERKQLDVFIKLFSLMLIIFGSAIDLLIS